MYSLACQFNRIRSIIQDNVNFQHALAAETSVTSIEDILQRVREFKSAYETVQALNERNFDENQQLMIDELKTQIHELKEETNRRRKKLNAITMLLQMSDNGIHKSLNYIAEIEKFFLFSEEMQFDHIHTYIQSSVDFYSILSKKISVPNNYEAILKRIDEYNSIIRHLYSDESDWINTTTDEIITKLQNMVKILSYF